MHTNGRIDDVDEKSERKLSKDHYNLLCTISVHISSIQNVYVCQVRDSNVFRVVIKIQLQMYNCCVCTTIFLCFSIFHVLVSVNIVMHYGVIVFQKKFTF